MFLGVAATISAMNDQDRAELAQRIVKARTEQNLSKEAAAKKAGVTTTTWRRAEAGLRLHDHKLAAVLEALGLSADGLPDSAEVWSNEQWADSVFVLPPAIETGYTDTVRFVKAVQDAAPPLTGRATRLMLDAASLLAAAGEYLLEVEGGDGDGDSAPTSRTRDSHVLIAHDEEHSIEDEQGHDETP